MTGRALLLRSLTWTPLAIAVPGALLAVAWPQPQPSPVPLMVAAILLAAAVGFALDDPAASILAVSPAPLLRRRLARLGVVVPPGALLWAVLLAWRGGHHPEELVALVLMFTGMVGLTLAVAAVATRVAGSSAGGMAAAPGIFAMLLASAAVPARWRPLPLGDVPGGWLQIHLRWGLAAVVGTAVVLAMSRDPAGRRPLRQLVTLRRRGAANGRTRPLAMAKCVTSERVDTPHLV